MCLSRFLPADSALRSIGLTVHWIKATRDRSGDFRATTWALVSDRFVARDIFHGLRAHSKGRLIRFLSLARDCWLRREEELALRQGVCWRFLLGAMCLMFGFSCFRLLTRICFYFPWLVWKGESISLDILWMDEILPHLRNPRMMWSPVNTVTNNGFNHDVLGGAKWISQPSTVCSHFYTGDARSWGHEDLGRGAASWRFRIGRLVLDFGALKEDWAQFSEVCGTCGTFNQVQKEGAKPLFSACKLWKLCAQSQHGSARPPICPNSAQPWGGVSTLKKINIKPGANWRINQAQSWS